MAAIEASRVIQWLLFQMGGVGPMVGEPTSSSAVLGEDPAGERPLPGESKQLLRLNAHLKTHEFPAGGHSIVDSANWTWARTLRQTHDQIEDLPPLQRWPAAIRARPAVRRDRLRPPSSVDLRTADEQARRFFEDAHKMMETGQLRESGVEPHHCRPVRKEHL